MTPSDVTVKGPTLKQAVLNLIQRMYPFIDGYIRSFETAAQQLLEVKESLEHVRSQIPETLEEALKKFPDIPLTPAHPYDALKDVVQTGVIEWHMSHQYRQSDWKEVLFCAITVRLNNQIKSLTPDAGMLDHIQWWRNTLKLYDAALLD